MRRIFILSAMLSCLLALPYLGCNSDQTWDATANLPIGRVQAINVIPGILWIQEGKTYRFEARGIFPGGSVGDVTFLASWTSTAPDIASILGPGLVKANRPGVAYVTCTYDGVTSARGTVNIPGIPLEHGIVPIHVEVSPGAANIPVEETGTLTFVPTPATPYEMSLAYPKPAYLYVLGDGGKIIPDFYWNDSTLLITSGTGNGLELDVLRSYLSPWDTVVGQWEYPYGHDWIPDHITVYEIDNSKGFPYDWGIVAGDTYMTSKRWVQFEAIADYSDGHKENVTSSSNWHLSNPTYGFITSTGQFQSTSAEPTNLIIYCEFSGLISNYVPIAVR